VIQLEWRHRSDPNYFDAHSLSDGTLRFMCLAALLLQPTKPSLIVIDEPELGLHPAAIVQLAALLRLASHDCQVIIATQSVTLLDQFASEDVIVVERRSYTGPLLQRISGWLQSVMRVRIFGHGLRGRTAWRRRKVIGFLAGDPGDERGGGARTLCGERLRFT
jgi:energy-coupling factor transporter ATP-binding protein EcfA2